MHVRRTETPPTTTVVDTTTVAFSSTFSNTEHAPPSEVNVPEGPRKPSRPAEPVPALLLELDVALDSAAAGYEGRNQPLEYAFGLRLSPGACPASHSELGKAYEPADAAITALVDTDRSLPLMCRCMFVALFTAELQKAAADEPAFPYVTAKTRMLTGNQRRMTGRC